MKRGKFIVLEGGEGAGKSTVAKELADRFDAALSREPGGTPFAEKLREEILYGEFRKEIYPLSSLALMWAVRFDHVKRFILPTLLSGENVVCDRFDGSTFAYQVFAENFWRDLPLFLHMRQAYLHECKPDLYLILDVPIEIGLERMEKKGGRKASFEERSREFHERVRKGFHQFSKLKGVPARVVNADRPLDEVIRIATREVLDLF